MSKCPVCQEGKMLDSTVTGYRYLTPMGFVTIDKKITLKECASCTEVTVPEELIAHWNHLILASLQDKRSLLTPTEVEFIFSVLPYTQDELATATGKDLSTLEKYKTGENPVDPLFEDALQQIIVDYLDGKDSAVARLKDRSEFVVKDEKIDRLKFH